MSIAARYDAYRIQAGEAYEDVWAYAPARDGQLTEPALETLAAARHVAEASNQAAGEDAPEDEVVAVALGEDAPRLGAACLEHGADTAYVAGNDALSPFRVAAHAGAVEDAIDNAYREAAGPRAVLLPDTGDGRDLASVLASRLDAGLVTGCRSLTVGDVTLQDEIKTGTEAATFERAVQGTREAADGHTETLACLDNEARDFRPACFTVAPGAYPAPERDPSRTQTGRILQIPVDLDARDTSVTVVDEEPREADPGLAEADRVVALGRGIHPRTGEGLEHGLALAEALDAELGVSRGVVTAAYDLDPELAPYADVSRQIGETGESVDADVYVAAGISGAHYHQVAVEADHVLAVNPDPYAPIREIADEVIEADLFHVLPDLADAIERHEHGDRKAEADEEGSP